MDDEWWSLGRLKDLLGHEFSKKVSWKTMKHVRFHYDMYSFPIQSSFFAIPWATFGETLEKLKKKAKT